MRDNLYTACVMTMAGPWGDHPIDADDDLEAIKKLEKWIHPCVYNGPNIRDDWLTKVVLKERYEGQVVQTLQTQGDIVFTWSCDRMLTLAEAISTFKREY